MKKAKIKVTYEPVIVEVEVNKETDTIDEIMALHGAEIRHKAYREYSGIIQKCELLGVDNE